MALLIGVDEAGLGPNLGPFVGTATVWEVPGHPEQTSLYELFADILTAHRAPEDDRWQVADSKAVYKPGFLEPLERGVWPLLQLLEWHPYALSELCHHLMPGYEEPHWLAEIGIPLPHTRLPEADIELLGRWKTILADHSIRLIAVRSVVVWPGEWNNRLDQWDNKAVVASRCLLELIGQVCPFDAEEPTLVLSDKHGGRARYLPLLLELADGRFVQTLAEGPESSRYRIGKTELRFEPRSEHHLPVAYASMVCKYIRELTMIQFNEFFRGHHPELRRTQGYPLDARRFFSEIEATMIRLGLSRRDIWRER